MPAPPTPPTPEPSDVADDVQRVAIVGSGGAGKSTLARELGARTGLPVVHLDERFWRPGWVATGTDEWSTVQRELAAAERWIMDGNYGATLDVRLARADTVIVLEVPRLRCLAAATVRTARHHGRAVQAEGCEERFDLAFLRWIWRYPIDSRPRLEAAIERHCAHLDVIRLRSRAAVRSYLAGVTP